MVHHRHLVHHLHHVRPPPIVLIGAVIMLIKNGLISPKEIMFATGNIPGTGTVVVLVLGVPQVNLAVTPVLRFRDAVYV